MLILALFSTNCFASNSELKDYEINEKISIENAEEFEKNIQKNINIDNVKYELQDVSKQENKQNINKEETQTKQKIVYTNNKYDVLNMFENKIEMTKDGMSGILELQNNSLDIKIKDSYIEQYKVALTKKYENVPTNELNDIPKSIEENGVTYYLVNPIWNISQVEKIEGQDVPIAYNGEMQYEGIKERKIVKSYLATVTYIGTLEKEETESITFNIKYKEMPQEEIAKEIKKMNFKTQMCARTIRNNIYAGDIYDIKSTDMIYNKEYKDKNKDKTICEKVPPEKSIDYRPEKANTREEYGHWEGDLVIGTRKRGAVLFTLTERKTREEIIVKIPGKKLNHKNRLKVWKTELIFQNMLWNTYICLAAKAYV